MLLSIRLGAGLTGWLARRRAALAGRTASALWAVADGLGDAALLLDGRGRIVAASAAARARLAGVGELLGRSVEELLGGDVALLRRGLRRGPACGRLALEPAAAAAVMARASSRPVRDLLVLRFDGVPSPPPLPEPAARTPARPPGLDLGALGAALLRPVERASTAAGLLRLSLPPAAGGAELGRIEAELSDIERRLRWLHGAGRERHAGSVDLAALVGELLGTAVPNRARLRAALRPARAWADPGRLRAALREVLRAAVGELPPGAELAVEVGPRGASAVVELSTAADAAEAAALARALVVPEGGEVEVETRAGRGGVCRISFPAG